MDIGTFSLSELFGFEFLLFLKLSQYLNDFVCRYHNSNTHVDAQLFFAIVRNYIRLYIRPVKVTVHHTHEPEFGRKFSCEEWARPYKSRFRGENIKKHRRAAESPMERLSTRYASINLPSRFNTDSPRSAAVFLA
jgi:hypothetical protein